MNTVYILLGANLGEPISQIKLSIQLINERVGNIIAQSSLYESEGWGVEDQPKFYNQILIIETALNPEECLKACQEIEIILGRIRDVKWGARVIDIDLLYFNNSIFNSPSLTIPHPYIHQRNFTLVPLVEVSPNFIHPKLNKTNAKLLFESKDNLLVNKIENAV